MKKDNHYNSRQGDFSFEIKENLAVLSTNEKSGWSLELNIVQWGDRDPVYDIRAWSPNHSRMGKGVTLQKDDLLSLREHLNKLELN